MESKERLWLTGIGIAVVVLVVAGSIGGVNMYQGYAARQKEFNKQRRIDLTTPQTATNEIMYSLQNGAPLRLYKATEFAAETPLQTENAFSTVAEQTKKALAFSRGYRYGEEHNPRAAASLRTIADVKVGTPQKLDAQHTDVPIECKAVFDGQQQTFSGTAHLIECGDGKWRLDCSRVTLSNPNVASIREFQRVLSDLFQRPVPGFEQ